jgi:trigger factor
MLRSTNAPLIEEPDGTEIARAHTLTIDFVGTIDGEPFEGGSGKGVQLEVGDGGFIPGFEDQLIGAHAGDDVDVRVTFPEDYANEGLAGKPAAFAVHIVDVRSRHLPDLDDEFAKDLGEFDSLEALRARIRSDLEAARERESKDTFRTSLMGALLERMDFEAPPGMIERQLHSQLTSAGRRLEGRLDEATIRAQMDRWHEEWRPAAERDVRETLALQAIATDQGIEVADEEVHARISEMLGEQQGEASDLQRLKQDEQLVGALRLQVRDDKVLEFLGERAKITKSLEDSDI